MEKNLAKNTFKFEFFNKTKAQDESLGLFGFAVSMLPLWGLMLIIFIGSIFINANKFDDILSKYINHKESSSTVSIESINSLSVSLTKKDWANVQYNLLMLRNLNSTQIDKEVLIILTNYSNKNKFYSNEFALLTTNYLTSMEIEQTEEKRRMNYMNNNIDYPWVKNITNKEEIFNQEIIIYNASRNEIKEKASDLIKVLKDTPLKERLLESVSKY